MMKKGLIKSAAVLFAAFSLGGVVVPPLTAHAEVLERMQGDRGEWRRDEHGWYFMLTGTTRYVAENWLYDNQKWYYFDHWGYMYRNAWINKEQLVKIGNELIKTDYGKYLLEISEEI